MNPSTHHGISVTSMVKATVREWHEHKTLRLSAALAYYSIFSLAPLLMICLAVAGWVYGAEAAQGHLEQQLREVVGPSVAKSLQSFISDARAPGGSLAAVAVGMATLLAGAAGVFYQLKDALNTLWDVRPASGHALRQLIGARLASFLMVLIIGALLLASVTLSTALAALTARWPSPPILAQVLTAVSSVGIFTLGFACLFKFLPDLTVRWRDVWIGALVTAVLFEAGKFGLSAYLGRESLASAYGAAASLIVVLLWVYYASLILFFGAAFTKVHARAHAPVAAPALDRPSRSAVVTVPVPAASPHAAGGADPATLIVVGAAAGLLAGLLWRHRALSCRHHAHRPDPRGTRHRHPGRHQSQ